MKIERNILFIGGGRMAEALINGILKAKLAVASQINVVEPLKPRQDELSEKYQVKVFAKAADAVSAGALVIIAVKPQIVRPVLSELAPLLDKGHLLVSIAAGVPLSLMEGLVGGSGARVIRVMPNTPALVLEGASALSPGAGVSSQ